MRLHLAVLALGFAALSCAQADTDEDDWSDEGLAVVGGVPVVNRAHLMPMVTDSGKFLQDDTAIAAAGTTKLEYFGGPVIGHAKIVAVLWGSNVDQASKLAAYYDGMAKSAMFDWLHEYNTPTQEIGRGRFLTTYTDTSPPAGSTITDEQIAAELVKLLDSGALPANDPDTLYMFHFPPGLTIKMGDYQSCSYFCAYHSTTTRGGNYVYYGVIPDMGGGCALGCGFNTKFNNITSVASHEVVEAVTDAAVGLAEDYAYPLGWYDKAGGQGEIGDICNAQQGTVAGYTLQKEYSNEKGACILSKTEDPGPSGNDFAVTAWPITLTVKAGATASYDVRTDVTNGSAQQVKLSVIGLPAGVTAAFDKSTVNAGETAKLTITAGSAAAGTTRITVGGQGTTASHISQPNLVVEAGGGPGPVGNLIANGDFEVGKKTGWQVDGSKVWATTKRAHTGKWSGKIGSSLPSLGDNGLYQGINVPATGKTTLSFWYYLRCSGTLANDQDKALITDASGKVLETVFSKCELSHSVWSQASVDLSKYAGQTITVYFKTHDDGATGTANYMYIDDVATVTQ